MKIPDQLKIGGHIVQVKLESDLPTMSGHMGDSWNAHNSIRICTIYPESQQAETLLHEILHHLMNNLGNPYKEGIHTEQNVEALAQVMFQVLRDNKLNFGETPNETD